MSARASRLDVRTTAKAKELIENAAHFLGVTTSAFILSCAMERATQILEQAEAIHLNRAEAKHFLSLLENPALPNENLKRLFKKYQKNK